MRMLTVEEAQERFRSLVRVDPETGCHVWTGLTRSKGHGTFYARGRYQGAHRWAMEWHLGRELPRNVWVLHKCDNPPCVNPEHLFLGDARANSMDMHTKHRGLARLSEAQVIDARRRVAAGERRTAIAREFGISSQALSKAVRGEAYRWVEDHS